MVYNVGNIRIAANTSTTTARSDMASTSAEMKCVIATGTQTSAPDTSTETQNTNVETLETSMMATTIIDL